MVSFTFRYIRHNFYTKFNNNQLSFDTLGILFLKHGIMVILEDKTLNLLFTTSWSLELLFSSFFRLFPTTYFLWSLTLVSTLFTSNKLYIHIIMLYYIIVLYNDRVLLLLEGVLYGLKWINDNVRLRILYEGRLHEDRNCVSQPTKYKITTPMFLMNKVIYLYASLVLLLQMFNELLLLLNVFNTCIT